MKKKLMTTMSLLQRLPTEWFAKKLMLAILLFAFTFPFALNATNYQEKYIWNKVYRPTNLALNSKALIMTLPAVTGQTHYSIQYILNKAFFPDSSALRVLIDSAAMAGIKVDSAFYADSSFNLFADSNYVVADLAVDTLDADSIKTRTAVVSDTFIIGNNKLYQSGGYIETPSSFRANNISAVTAFIAPTFKNASSLPMVLNFSYNANDSIPFVMKGYGGDTVIDVDSFNNTRIKNDLIVDDTLTIGNNDMFDNGTYISTPYFQTTTQMLSENTFSKYYYNISGEPVVFYCKHGFDDSIVFVLMGNALAADTFLTADSLGNLLAHCNLTVKDTLIYYNSNQILFKVITQDSMLTITQDAWTSFKFEKQALNTDTDYFLFAPGNDSTKIVIKKAGYYKFKARYAYVNNTIAAVNNLIVAGRLTANSAELICSQILRQCDMKDATSRVLAASGFFNASVNDTIRLQYYCSDPNIDFHSSSVFDSLFVVGMSLEYMK